MTECRVDLHVKVLDGRVVERAKACGLDVLVYAPHFQRLPAIRSRAESFSDDELLVVPAREVFTGTWRKRKHLLAVGLRGPVPDFITLDGALAEFDRQDAAVLVPHPGFATVSLDADDLRRHRSRIDAIETYNPKQTGVHAKPSIPDAVAGVPPFGSSYAHLRGTVGEVWTTFDASVSSEADLVDALKDRAPRRVYHRSGPTHRFRCAVEFAHLGWENSWGKLDRVLLSGMEPTHPRHVAYDGQFDDVAVY